MLQQWERTLVRQTLLNKSLVVIMSCFMDVQHDSKGKSTKLLEGDDASWLNSVQLNNSTLLYLFIYILQQAMKSGPACSQHIANSDHVKTMRSKSQRVLRLKPTW